jgi:hypothetical protein
VFAPVTMLFKATNLDHAIALANDTQFGFGSSEWTNVPAEQKSCDSPDPKFSVSVCRSGFQAIASAGAMYPIFSG